MHELAIATAVLNTAVKHADERTVEVVAVRVGAFRQVVPESLRFYWEIVARDTVCEGAQLELEPVDAGLRCEECGHEWTPPAPIFRCPGCASSDVTVTGGNELEVEYIELKESAYA